MAQVSYNQGLPTISPDATPPEDSQRIQATPAEFGAATAQGLEKAGAGATQTGKFFGQVQTDDAVSTAMTTVNGVLDKYRALNGRDALDAQAPTQQAIDEAFKNGRQGLSTAEQQYQYDQTVRTYQQRYVAGIVSTHADQAAKVFTDKTNKASLDVALAGVANVADDPAHVEIFKEDARSAMVKQVQAEGNGNDTESVNDAITRADRAVYKTWAETVAVKDPAAALKIVDDHKDVMGLEYAQLSAHLRTRVNEQTGLSVADQAFATTAQKLNNAPSPQNNVASIREAILQQESGNSNAAPKSANGAVGPGQIIPATFQQYAKPGEDINNPADNRAVATRIVDDLSNKYGGDPARVAVGYFSGPGNVAPAGSATPWLRDVTDANGKSVSSYVQDVTQRVGTQGALLAARAGVYDNVISSTEGNPQVRQIALREVDQRYRAAEISSLADQKALKEQRDTALRGYGDVIRSGQGGTPWRKDPGLSEEQVEHLDTLQRNTLNEAINGRPGDYGPGYSDVQSRIFSTGQGKIVNQEQLLEIVARGQINPAGYQEASKLLTEVNKPGAEADRVLQGNFYKSAQRAITLESELVPGLKRIGGDDKWNQALPVLNQALAQGRAKGLTNAELMDPANKSSVWPALKPFLPSQEEVKQANMLEAIADDHKQAAAAFDASKITSYEELKQANHEGKVSVVQARDIVAAHPEWGVKFRGPGPQTAGGPAVPVPQ